MEMYLFKTWKTSFERLDVVCEDLTSFEDLKGSELTRIVYMVTSVIIRKNPTTK